MQFINRKGAYAFVENILRRSCIFYSINNLNVLFNLFFKIWILLFKVSFERKYKMTSSRAQEKEELRDLNKRLTSYIEKVRRLESDKNSLKFQVSNHLDYSEKEVKGIKTLYDEELENANARINSLANENAKLCIEKDRYKSVLEEANLKLAKRDKDVKTWEERTFKGEALVIEFKSRYESLLLATQDNHDELIRLKSSYNDMESQLFTARTNLESQVYFRTELENKIKTLTETLAFKTAMYEKEINLLKDRNQIEMDQIVSTTDEEEESRFLSELQKIRDETDEKNRKMNNEIEKRYVFRISNFIFYFILLTISLSIRGSQIFSSCRSKLT